MTNESPRAPLECFIENVTALSSTKFCVRKLSCQIERASFFLVVRDSELGRSSYIGQSARSLDVWGAKGARRNGDMGAEEALLLSDHGVVQRCCRVQAKHIIMRRAMIGQASDCCLTRPTNFRLLN